jgi:hypothetical protein
LNNKEEETIGRNTTGMNTGIRLANPDRRLVKRAGKTGLNCLEKE